MIGGLATYQDKCGGESVGEGEGEGEGDAEGEGAGGGGGEGRPGLEQLAMVDLEVVTRAQSKGHESRGEALDRTVQAQSVLIVVQYG